MGMEVNVVVLAALAILTCVPWRVYSVEHRLSVKMTLVRNASALGAGKLISQREKKNIFNFS